MLGLTFGGLGLVLRSLLRSRAHDVELIDLTTAAPAPALVPTGI